ncbi:unnamed protein product [Dovyalis caffra]|uniref:Uncharacterized protein n=1 Tax=Dovyalis caffra TaxID=77055 RepID=A0AAV1RUA7_9ROSI|nr:unnamed protein product [Dovyalis caffra]
MRETTSNKLAQKKNPKARATKDAKNAGTKMVASDVGLGAGASAAVAFCMVEKAIKTTINATKTFIFIASIFLINLILKERKTGSTIPL